MQENELIELVDKVTVLMEKYHRNTDKVGQTYAQSAQRHSKLLKHVLEVLIKRYQTVLADLKKAVSVRRHRCSPAFRKKWMTCIGLIKFWHGKWRL